MPDSKKKKSTTSEERRRQRDMAKAAKETRKTNVKLGARTKGMSEEDFNLMAPPWSDQEVKHAHKMRSKYGDTYDESWGEVLEDRKRKKARGWKSGGSVRGVGKALRGFGKAMK